MDTYACSPRLFSGLRLTSPDIYTRAAVGRGPVNRSASTSPGDVRVRNDRSFSMGLTVVWSSRMLALSDNRTIVGQRTLDNATEPAIVPPTERTLADLIVQQLRKQIILGRLPPGERLTEARLSEELDVSRGTVREALRRLEAESLVESVSHRGSRVAALSPDDAVQISEIHSILGSHAVRQLELPINKELCRKLTGIAREMRELRVPEDVDRFIELDNQFHRAIVEASGQRRVLQVWYGVSALLGILVGMSLRDTDLSGDEIAARHELVIAALCQPDRKIASDSIVDHYHTNELRLRTLATSQENGKGGAPHD